MSNHLAIATVTAALGQLVHTAVLQAVSGTTLLYGRPDTSGPANARRLHVYLVQVSPNGALRNADLPARAPAGPLVGRPGAALDLFYMLSFNGDPLTLEPHRMLGAVTRTLHAQPVLTQAAIQNAVASLAELSGSDLADAVERVRFTPVQLPLEELSKLWSVLIETPHMLSVMYQASVVVIDSLSGATRAAPVLRRGPDDRGVESRVGPFPQLDAFWFGDPAADGVVPRPRSLPNAQLGARLQLTTQNAGGDTVSLRFAHPRLPPLDLTAPDTARTPERITLDLPDDGPAQAAWAAGIVNVTIVTVRAGSERVSNTLPMPLAPHVTAVSPNPVVRDGAGTATVTLTCRPMIRPEQEVFLLVLDRQVRAQPLGAASANVTFVIPDAPALTDALVRVRIDGVENLPFAFDAPTERFVFDDNQRWTIS